MVRRRACCRPRARSAHGRRRLALARARAIRTPPLSPRSLPGFCCGCDLYSYPNDTVWWPSGDWTPDWPIVDFSADFHVFGVELNDTALRFYVDNATNTIKTLALPPLCLTDPAFEWGKTMYMPFRPLYGILNVAVAEDSASVDLAWWQTHNATTLVDWVRWYEFVESEAPVTALPAAGGAPA